MQPTSPRPRRLAPLLALTLLAACGSSDPVPFKPGARLTVKVAPTFAAGTVLRERYTGQAVTVDASGAVSLTPDPTGVVLLEPATAAAQPFNWANATVYFVLTDRFLNGDKTNDQSYGRKPDGVQEVGTWHGGDLKGLTSKLDYLKGLGVTAIWISSVVEQVHGWVSGGQNGDFKYYPYHGYWALDFTTLDANLGTPQELHDLVDAAHAKGLRVLLDVVINHPGYATGDDLVAYLPELFKDKTGAAFKAFTPGPGQSWVNWNDLVDYSSSGWVKWWGPKWIRAGFPGFDTPGTDDLTRQLTFLPDMKTESTEVAPVPAFFAQKAGTGVAGLAGGGTPRQYLARWHSDWVRQYGFDGFRCDTAKNVEVGAWQALKAAALQALAEWKANNPSKKLDDAPFWMTGEVYGHGLSKDEYYTSGAFDSLINFKFQPAVQALFEKSPDLVKSAAELDSIYSDIAGLVSTDAAFDVLSYLSSHDTRVFYSLFAYDAGVQRQAGSALLLAPGGVQIFYGDESGRRLGPASTDSVQGTRSDMNWDTTDAAILAHWQKLGLFRKDHPAVGAGVHGKLASPPGTYAFSRTLSKGGVDDKVVVVLTVTK